MGSFESYVYADGTWGDSATDDPWLSIALHDSDFATVRYSPAPEGLGLFYVGYQPSDYFQSPGDNDAVDTDGEAEGFAAWASSVSDADVAASDVLPFVAPGHRVGDPEDVFVEETIDRLLVTLGLPALPMGDDDELHAPENLHVSVLAGLARWEVERSQRLVQGDILLRPRDIEHLASFRTRADATRAAAVLEARGFTVQVARSFVRTLLRAVRWDMVTRDSVASVLTTVVLTVEENGGKYDGFSDAPVD